MALAGFILALAGGLLWFATGYHYSQIMRWQAHHTVGLIIAFAVTGTGMFLMGYSIYADWISWWHSLNGS